jgi:hypothetical protein
VQAFEALSSFRDSLVRALASRRLKVELVASAYCDDWLPVAAVALRTACTDRCSSAVRGRNASKHRTSIGKRCSVAIEGELLACDDDKPPLRSGDDADKFNLVSACVQKPAVFDARRQGQGILVYYLTLWTASTELSFSSKKPRD